MLIEQHSSRRPQMIRNLVRYGSYSVEVLAALTDRQIEDLADRLKHCIVVSDGSYTVVGMHQG